jgi:hypothetical protein
VLRELVPVAGRTTNVRVAAVRTMVVPALVLTLAATATVSANAALWLGVRGPVCPLGHWLGEAACPGCGLTRATSLVVQGRWLEAWHVQPAGFAVAALCAGLVVLQLDVLRRGVVLDGHLVVRRAGRWLFVGAVPTAWFVRAVTTWAASVWGLP